MMTRYGCLAGRGLAATLACAVLLASPAMAAPYDWDNDGDVAVSDFRALLDCWTAPGVNHGAGPCAGTFNVTGDLGPDTDIDLEDFAHFARLFTGPLLLAVDQAVATNEDWTLNIILSAEYSETPAPPFQYTISGLPAAGRLWQHDTGAVQGAPFIDRVPTVVTDPQGQVWFRGDLDAFGDPYTTFEYTVTDPATGQTSPAATVTITVAPRNDAPRQGAEELTVDEDAPGFFLQVPEAVDPEGDAITYYAINDPFSYGATIYQVAADDETVLDAFPSAYTPLTNPNRWIFVEIAPDWDRPVTLPFAASDDQGAFGYLGEARININPINDPPQVAARTATFFDTTTDPISLVVEVTDDEPSAGFWEVTITDFPDFGRLYHTAVEPRNELTPTAPAAATTAAACSDAATYCAGSLQLYYVPDQPLGTGTPYDGFSYAVSDGALSAAAAYTLDVLSGPRPPESTSPTDVYTSVDTPVTFTLSATDANGDQILVSFQDLPDHGVLQAFDTIDAIWFPVFPGGELPLDSNGERLMRYVPGTGYTNDGGAPDELGYLFRDFQSIGPALTLNFHVSGGG